MTARLPSLAVLFIVSIKPAETGKMGLPNAFERVNPYG